MTAARLQGLLDFASAAPTESGQAVFTTRIDPVFTVGPKVHGGTLQMLAAYAATTFLRDIVGGHEAENLVPVAISSTFISSPDPADVRLTARIGKRGRRVWVVDVDIEQNGRVQSTNSVTLGRPDSGEPRYSIAADHADFPSEPDGTAVDVADSPFRDIFHLCEAVEVHVDPAALPFVRGETGEPSSRLWARPHGMRPGVPFTVLACDLSMPVVMNLGYLGWSPTLQLTTYIRRVPADGWLRIQARSTEVGDRWFEEDHLILDSTGAVVAQSRQLAMLPG